MKKASLILITLLVVWGNTLSQTDYREVNFGLLSYQLQNSNLPQSALESIQNTFASIGDKEIVLEEIFKRLLYEPNTAYADSLIEFWKSDYTDAEKELLLEVPNLTNNWRSNVFMIYWMSVFGKAYVDDISWLRASLQIHADKNIYFPNLPDQNIGGQGMGEEQYMFYSFSKWYIAHPEEFKYFLQLYRNQSMAALNDDSDESLKQLIDVIRQGILERNTVAVEMLPPEDFDKEGSITGNRSTSMELRFADLCTEENITEFINEAYKVVYQELPGEQTLAVLEEYVLDHNLFRPELIYLALLLNKYE